MINLKSAYEISCGTDLQDQPRSAALFVPEAYRKNGKGNGMKLRIEQIFHAVGEWFRGMWRNFTLYKMDYLFVAYTYFMSAVLAIMVAWILIAYIEGWKKSRHIPGERIVQAYVVQIGDISQKKDVDYGYYR